MEKSFLSSLFGGHNKKNDEPQVQDNFAPVKSASPASFRADRPVATIETLETQAPANDASDSSVLVVDDDADILQYLKEELCSFCKNVYLASGPLKAIEYLKDKPVDIIVSDIMMPGMDGFEFCHYVKTSVAVSHIPVILLTARVDENSKLLGYKNGADDYITKPFDVDVLKAAIVRLLNVRNQVRQRCNVPNEALPSTQESTFSSADEIFLQKFHTVVTENISDPDLDIRTIVKSMGMSRTLIYNKITQLTGLNIKEYVNKARMEHVINLLKTTDLPLGVVAEKSGFNSPRYFSTAFKNYTGKTPSRYKKENCI